MFKGLFDWFHGQFKSRVGATYMIIFVRPEKFQFLEKGQNRNFDYEIVISVKSPEFIL